MIATGVTRDLQGHRSLAIFVRPSVRRNPPLVNGKGRHRESKHSRYIQVETEETENGKRKRKSETEKLKLGNGRQHSSR